MPVEGELEEIWEGTVMAYFNVRIISVHSRNILENPEVVHSGI
jgi:hypothetical protein